MHRLLASLGEEGDNTPYDTSMAPDASFTTPIPQTSPHFSATPGRNGPKKGLSILGQFTVPDALDLKQRLTRGRSQACHVPQRGIAKHHLGRHAPLACERPPQSAEMIKEVTVHALP